MINVAANAVVVVSDPGGLRIVTVGSVGANPNALAGAGLVASGAVLNVVGTADRIAVSADSIDIASTYAGQSTITTVGTVTTGTWASVIATEESASFLNLTATGTVSAALVVGTGGVRATGQGSMPVGSGGVGAELLSDGAFAYFLGYNRTSGAYVDTYLHGAALTVGGLTGALTLKSANVAALTFDVNQVATFAGRLLVPDGTTAAPAISPSGQSAFGLTFDSAYRMRLGYGGSAGNVWYYDGGSNIQQFNGGHVSLYLSGTTTALVAFGASADTGISRLSAGVIGIGTGAGGSIAGTLSAARLISGLGTSTVPAIQVGTNATLSGLVATADGIGVALTRASGGMYAVFYPHNQVGIQVRNDLPIGWPSVSTFTGTTSVVSDTTLSRVSAGVIGIGTGTAGSIAGSLSMASLTTSASVLIQGLTLGSGPATAANNTIFGQGAGAAITTSGGNVAIGRDALNAATATGDRQIAIGQNALKNSDNYLNVAIGYVAGSSLTTGHENVFLGGYAGLYATTASFNVIIGTSAAFGVLTGQSNVAIGYSALASATSGSRNIALGHNAAANITTGSDNMLFGESTGYTLTTGGTNVLIGGGAAGGTASSGQSLTTGSGNVMVGNSTGRDTTTGNTNTFLGKGAGYSVTTGSNNVIIGNLTGSGIAALSGYMLFGTGGGTEMFRATPSGNILIGTTTETATAGIIQLATGTTAATGILAGTDTNLYRSAAATWKTDGTFIAAAFTASSDGGAAAPVFNFVNRVGTGLFLVGTNDLGVAVTGSWFPLSIAQTALKMGATVVVSWSDTANSPYSAAADVGLSRVSAGILGVGTGAAGSFAGTLQVNRYKIGSTLGLLQDAANYCAITGGSTSQRYQTVSNTGASLVFGVENNTGATLTVGSSAYAVVLCSVGATALEFGTTNTIRMTISAAGLVTIIGGLKLAGGTTLVSTASALTDGAGAGVGTLTTAPSAGDPTKWIGIDDNGTTRYVPAW